MGVRGGSSSSSSKRVLLKLHGFVLTALGCLLGLINLGLSLCGQRQQQQQHRRRRQQQQVLQQQVLQQQACVLGSERIFVAVMLGFLYLIQRALNLQ
jgi:hypothetical protein